MSYLHIITLASISFFDLFGGTKATEAVASEPAAIYAEQEETDAQANPEIQIEEIINEEAAITEEVNTDAEPVQPVQEEVQEQERTVNLNLGHTQIEMPEAIQPGFVNVTAGGSSVTYCNPDTHVNVNYADSHIRSGNNFFTSLWEMRQSGNEIIEYTLDNKTTIVVIAGDEQTKSWEILQNVGADNNLAIHIDAPADVYTDAEAVNLFTFPNKDQFGRSNK